MLPASAAWAGSQRQFVPAQQVPPKQYGHAVCTAVSEWETNLKSAEKALESDLSGTSNLVAAKDALTSFVDTAVQETDAVLTEIRQAGVPEIKNGNRIARLIETGFTDIRSVFARAQDSSRQLSTTDRAQFVASASDVGKTIEQGTKKVAQTFKRAERKYKSASRALDDPACHP